MKIAVITGASSGLGREYALSVDKSRNNIDEIWIIARREDKLIELSKNLNTKSRILAIDITDNNSLKTYTELLKTLNADVKILINNAGFGKLNNFEEISTEDNCSMVRLNCEALTAMTSLTLPFMSDNSEIINTCSIASFAPNTRMAVYCSTKAYVMSLSRALRIELKNRKINVIAVCPGPMDTEFLPVAGIEKGSSKTFDTLPRVNPKVMAEKSLIASSKGKSVYTNLLFFKFYRFISKVLPHNIIMKMSAT